MGTYFFFIMLAVTVAYEFTLFTAVSYTHLTGVIAAGTAGTGVVSRAVFTGISTTFPFHLIEPYRIILGFKYTWTCRKAVIMTSPYMMNRCV